MRVSDETLTWLLDPETPAVRHVTLRHLLGRSPTDPEVVAARQAAHETGPIPAILDAMAPEGYWIKEGAGYSPKYRGTVWSVILLSQLGATVQGDPRIERACAYLLDNALASQGRFGYNGRPSGNIECLQGNLLAALLDLGYADPRIDDAFAWAAQSVTGEGVAPKTEKKAPLRYYAYNCGPGFVCGANNSLPCAWGAVKIMLAFSKLPADRRTPEIERAIQQGVDFLFSVDPAEATYPTGYSDKPSRNWWKFGFPVFYVTDLLQLVEALVGLGYGHDPRLANALDLIRDKADDAGRWRIEYRYTSKTIVPIESRKQPSKWVTLRALRVLQAAQRPA